MACVMRACIWTLIVGNSGSLERTDDNMNRHFRTYHDPLCECADCLIGYSPAGFWQADAEPEPEPVIGEHGGPIMQKVIWLAEQGATFTVRELMAQMGIASRSAYLYEVLGELVERGRLNKRQQDKKAAVYSGAAHS